MVPVFYERLPIFCFKCGLVGHGEGACSLNTEKPLGVMTSEGEMVVDQIPSQQTGHLEAVTADFRGATSDQKSEDENQYGPWLVVQRRHRGRGGDRTPVMGTGGRASEGAPVCDTWKEGNERNRHVLTPDEMQMLRGGSRTTRGDHSLMPRDRKYERWANPLLIDEENRDGVSDHINMEPLNRDMSESSLISGQTAAPRLKGPSGDLVGNDGPGDRGDVPSDVDVIVPRKIVEKGKGIMASSHGPRMLLMTSVSGGNGDPDHSPSPLGSQRQCVNGVHNNLVDRIMDAMQDKAGDGKDAGNSDGNSDRVELEEEMTLSQYQMENRGETSIRRGVVKAASQTKKGRSSPY